MSHVKPARRENYPFALALMLCVSFTLYFIFKHRGWL